jgi:predicted DNA-binding transcriptional regulator AlpA
MKNDPQPPLPREWLRVNEACDYSRLSKPKMYELMKRGLIKSAELREPGKIKGSRLISFSSLKDFLEACTNGTAFKQEKEGAE